MQRGGVCSERISRSKGLNAGFVQGNMLAARLLPHAKGG